MCVVLCGAIAACQLDEPDDPEEGARESALDEACVWAPTLQITPATVPATAPGVPIVFDVAITNPNPAACAPISYVFDVADVGLLTTPRPRALAGGAPEVAALASGETRHVPVTAVIPASADAGDVFPFSVRVLDPPPAPPAPPAPPRVVPSAPVPLTVAALPGCQISAARELMITNVSVVDDPIRTVFDPASTDPRNGVWSFKHLVEQMAKTPKHAPAMVEAMLTSFTTTQTINGFTVDLRPGMQAQVLAAWPRTATGELDLAKAPLRLQAIVNRVDLRDLDAGDAGEGRFIYAFILPPIPGAPPPEATIIFEYKLPAWCEQDVAQWAHSFHALGALPFGESYNAALQAITQRFVRRGARPFAPSGNAINAVRTNELPFAANGLWELREFRLGWNGKLEPAALELTPDLSFNNTAALAGYINAHEDEILAEEHVVPKVLGGQRFKAGAILNDLTTWLAPGVDDEARHRFAVNTCNGCHAAQETGTLFLHIVPRAAGTESRRSRWLTGLVADDPVTGAPRTFDDLGRRKADLKKLVCQGPAPAPVLQKGIRRVH